MSRRLLVISSLTASILTAACADAPEPRSSTQSATERSETTMAAGDSRSAGALDLTPHIPPGWHALDTAVGQLDRSGPEDVVLVLEAKTPEVRSKTWLGDSVTVEDRPRRLLVLVAEPDGKFREAARGDGVVLAASEGGVRGDPFVGVAVERGAVVVDLSGGSSSIWNLTYRFRLEETGWVLIGATHSAGNAESAFNYDWNLSTGRLDIVHYGDSGDARKQRRVMARPTAPVHLQAFVPWSLEPAPGVWF